MSTRGELEKKLYDLQYVLLHQQLESMIKNIVERKPDALSDLSKFEETCRNMREQLLNLANSHDELYAQHKKLGGIFGIKS